MKPDLINKPPHYRGHPSGVECIELAENYGFCLGNAFKYLFRCGSKDAPEQDLRKARWYLERELAKREDILFRWFTGEDRWIPEYDGTHAENLVLKLEHRYAGHMCYAMRMIMVAAACPRGVECLDTAIDRINAMLRIIEHRKEVV